MEPANATPPVARRNNVVRSLHGVDRPDPYAWMLDSSAPEFLGYLEAERAYYDAVTVESQPLVATLAEEMIARLPRDDVSVPWQLREFSYADHQPAGAEYLRLLRAPRGTPLDVRTAELVLDPAEFATESSFVEVGVRLVSPDERLLGYSLDLTGEEVFSLRFRDIATGEDLDDRVPDTCYGGAWSADSRHFFYTRYDESYRPCQLWRHEVGTPTSDDTMVLEEPDTQYELQVRLARSGEVILARLSNDDTSEVWLIDARRPHDPPSCVEPRRRGIQYDVEHARADSTDIALIVTNDEALEFRVMWAPLLSPGRANWSELVPSRSDERVYRVDAFVGHAVVILRRDGELLLRAISLRDGLSTLPRTTVEIVASVPAGTITLGTCTDFDTAEIVVIEESYTQPPSWSALDLSSGTRQCLKTTEVPGYDAAQYLSERRGFPGFDGTPIPITIVRHVSTALDGSAPAVIYAYGSYESVDDPGFEEGLPSLLDRGVVFVHAHVRGGGEGGRRWWFDGRLEHKQNTFSDLISVADGLDGLVDGNRIATRGLSAGGLLQGAVFSQRPDRWRAVVAEVPFVDVVTTLLDESAPLMSLHWDEWGDPRRPADFAWTLAYSPYDNLPPAGGRPDLLITGALHDSRVMVSAPAKWAAALRASDPDWSPRCLFRCELGVGAHTGPSGRSASLRYEAEIYAWLLTRLTEARGHPTCPAVSAGE